VANFVADPQHIQQVFATSEPFSAERAGIEARVLLTSDAAYNRYRVMFTAQDFSNSTPRLWRSLCRRLCGDRATI
jgi:NitT/TauT family transport system substrate-binding protein